jgi:vacuolar-type H+-ATPase subunit I/STV1
VRLNDLVHLGLMLAAFAVAYLVPFELLLLAYVVLGPAHYITEISWLHDRSYFLPHRGIAVALAFLAAILVFVTNASWFGFVVWTALVACVMLATGTTALEGLLIFMIAVALTAWMLSTGSPLGVIGALVPTLVHVSLFTLVFMTLGAIRSASRAQALLIVVYLVAIAMILLVPPAAEVRIESFAKATQDYFSDVGPALSRLFHAPGLKLDARLTGLLAFIYTYHYLNWFIKVDIIRWADVPKLRLGLMIAASAFSTALYFYSFTYGFIFLLALSLAHVLLEFPLNALAVRQLGGAAATGLRHAFAGGAPATVSRAKTSRSGKRR